MTIPKIKVCCISSLAEAEKAIKYGAYAIGLVGKMPSGPGVISDALIAQIAEVTPAGIETFLLTSQTTAPNIIAHYKKVHTTTIQIVDEVGLDVYKQLRDELPSIKLVQVVHVLDAQSIKYALKVSSFVDNLLLDSGNPNLRIKQLGGTGRTHNWSISKRIVEESPVPVFLAGGLHADNVQEAIETVNPFGLDLCSGLRTDGQLDEKKLTDFFTKFKLC